MYSEALRKFPPPAPEPEVAAGGAPPVAAGGAEVVGAGVASEEDGAAVGVSSGLVVAVAADDMIDGDDKVKYNKGRDGGVCF